MKWRFGGDLGTNSLGWCAIELDEEDRPFRVEALGSRIFSDGRDPKSKQSLATERREARAARRRRARYLQRKDALLRHLVRAGLFPPEGDVEARRALQDLDPFALRARGLDFPLEPYELGRALFHINQRRGFKSNRKADRKTKDDESGKIKIGVRRLKAAMDEAEARTFGEFLHKRRQEAVDDSHIPSVRTRLRPETGEGAKGDGYDFYPDRAILEEECQALTEAQAAFHPEMLTEAVRDALFEVVFHQRPLKPVEVGLCTLLHHTGERRLAKAHPLFQRRRLLEEVNALRIVRVGETSQALTLDQRNALLLKLNTTGKVAYASLRTKVLKLDRESRFNKESENRPEMKGDEVAAVMAAKTRFGDRWGLLTVPQQWEVIDRVFASESDAELAALEAWLRETHHLSPEAAHATTTADKPLPEGYGRFGETATRRLIEAMQAEVIVYSEAVEAIGLHHSDFRTGEVFDDLPYYGEVLQRHITPGSGAPEDEDQDRYGRLTNPTVHIGLNQLRRVLNRLIKRYGPPAEIALELARELKLSEEQKNEINTRNLGNRQDAEKRSTKLGELGVADKGSNRQIIKLWEELNRENVLDRRCVYTGAQISAEMLFSGAVEVDHILPFAETLDDGQSNRLLCLREANREKRKRSPYEAFGHTARWEEMAARAARLPREKRWRFEPDAMQRFDRDGGFLARQLTDTQHLAKLAREYVGALYPGRGEDSQKVWVSPGRLTEMLRRSWGLNSLLPDHNYGGGADHPKNRLDHRHHAIDAVVIAVTDRGLLQRIARESGQKGHEEARRLTADLPTPWPDFRDDLKSAVSRVTASHRADHGTVSKTARVADRDATAGRLHNDTAYGLTGVMEGGLDLVVRRRPLMDLKPDDLIEGGRRVADDNLREALREATAGTEGKAFQQALSAFAAAHPQYGGVRRVRVLEPLSVIPIRDVKGRAYKAYKGDANHRFDVWEVKGGGWDWEVVSMFDAHQPGWTSRIRSAHHNAKKVISLQINDLIAIDRGAGRELLRVAGMNEGGRLTLSPPNEAGKLKERDADKADPFKYVYCAASRLKAWGARQVRIDELGHVLDPGPRSLPAERAAA